MNAFIQAKADYQELYERKNSPNYIVFNDYIGRMDPDEKEVWCLALESGQYEQGKLMLVTPKGKFCCLGVYCEIKGIPKHEALRDLPFGDETTRGLVTVYGTDVDRGTYTYIPHDFDIELTYPEGTTGPVGFERFMYNGGSGLFSAWTQNEDGKMDKFVEVTLPNLNDDGFTFKQIADIIRYFL